MEYDKDFVLIKYDNFIPEPRAHTQLSVMTDQWKVLRFDRFALIHKLVMWLL